MGRNKIRALFRELTRGGVEDELAGGGGQYLREGEAVG